MLHEITINNSATPLLNLIDVGKLEKIDIYRLLKYSTIPVTNFVTETVIKGQGLPMNSNYQFNYLLVLVQQKTAESTN